MRALLLAVFAAAPLLAVGDDVWRALPAVLSKPPVKPSGLAQPELTPPDARSPRLEEAGSNPSEGGRVAAGPAEAIPPPVSPLPPDSDAQSRAAAAFAQRPIGLVGVDIQSTPGPMPEDAAARDGVGAISQSAGVARCWPVVGRPWAAAAVAYRPLYFEQVNVERYGYTPCALLQPGLSAAHFCGSTLMLPYRIGAEPPREVVYTLGHYRPGSLVPRRRPGCPMSLRGVTLEAAAVVGLIALLP